MKNTQKGFISVGLVIGIIAILALVSGVAYKAGQQKSVQPTDTVQNVETKLEDSEIVAPKTVQSKESTLVTSPSDPSLMTYTSYKLGVQFDYLKDGGHGPHFVVKPEETDNKITLAIYVDGRRASGSDDEYIQFFAKLPNESVEQTIRRAVPNAFNTKNCILIPNIKDSTKESYFIWDSRVSSQYRHQTSRDFMGSDGNYLVDVCNSRMSLDFWTDSNHPEYIYYISTSTQAVSYWADSAHTIMWPQTIRLISKQ